VKKEIKNNFIYNVLKICRTLSDHLNFIIGRVCIVFFLILFFTLIAQIFFRYAIRNPLQETEELSRFVMIWMGLLGISVAFKNKSHLGVNMFCNLLPEMIQKLLLLIVRLIMLFFLTFVIVKGFEVSFLVKPQIAPATKISMFWPMLSLPVFGIVTFIQVILGTIIDFIEMIYLGQSVKKIKEVCI